MATLRDVCNSKTTVLGLLLIKIPQEMTPSTQSVVLGL